MGDISESNGPETLDDQLSALKSSSTNLRIEALRKLQHEIQNAGMANQLEFKTANLLTLQVKIHQI